MDMSPHDPGAASLMTPLGIIEGEALAQLESSGPTSLRTLIRRLNWPSRYVTMAVGALVREGLVRARELELDVIVEPAS